MLRYKADIKSIIYMLCITGLTLYLFFYGFTLPTYLFVVLWGVQLLVYVTPGVMVHNHQHVPMWKNKTLNLITDCYLTILYGYPIFGWIPTHLQNHHLHGNKEEDYTKTYAYSEKNNLWTLIRYPGHSGKVQQKAIGRYIKEMRSRNKEKFNHHMMEIASLVVYLAVFLIIDWKSALLFIVLPQQIALNSMLLINYIQHIHADEHSEYNHSRNFTGRLLNAILFNNGYHTAHHIKPHLHWSKLPDFHRTIEAKIDPELNTENSFTFLIKQYLLAPFIPRLGTKSMRKTVS